MVKRKRNYAARIRKAAQKAEDERAAAAAVEGIEDHVRGHAERSARPQSNDDGDDAPFTGDEGGGSDSDDEKEHEGGSDDDFHEDRDEDDDEDDEEETTGFDHDDDFGDDDEDEEEEEEEEEEEDGDEDEEEELGLISRGSSDESDYGDDDDDDDDEEGEEERRHRSQGAGPSRVPAKFLEGEKGESFAKAFSKILQQKTKKQTKQIPEAADSPVEEGPILAESKSVAKRKAEEQEAAKASRAAKKLRLDMRRRGHVRATRKGEDLAADLKEKQLNRLATRGVVLLFNAVATAQKQRQDAARSGAAAGGTKAARLNKASFLSQLKASAATAEGADAGATVAAAPSAGSLLGLGRRSNKAPQASTGLVAAPGWKVLQEGFTGLPGSSKMKDWDKAQSESDDPDRIEVESEDEGDDGW